MGRVTYYLFSVKPVYPYILNTVVMAMVSAYEHLASLLLRCSITNGYCTLCSRHQDLKQCSFFLEFRSVLTGIVVLATKNTFLGPLSRPKLVTCRMTSHLHSYQELASPSQADLWMNGASKRPILRSQADQTGHFVALARKSTSKKRSTFIARHQTLEASKYRNHTGKFLGRLRHLQQALASCNGPIACSRVRWLDTPPLQHGRRGSWFLIDSKGQQPVGY